MSSEAGDALPAVRTRLVSLVGPCGVYFVGKFNSLLPFRLLNSSFFQQLGLFLIDKFHSSEENRQLAEL